MNQKQRLELTWIGKGQQPNLEPRILIEDPEKSYGDKNSENMLIYGDNLLALKALEQDYAGKIKCIYIDPPYNTGNAFDHYDDNLEHSIWLNLIKPRIELLRKLLREDGSIWISIDDDESHYLKVLCDEIFGRQNFVNTIIWHKKHTRSNDARWLSDNHDFILVFAKNKNIWKRNLLPRTDNINDGYTNVDNDPRGPWASGPCHAKTPNVKDIYPILTPSGRELLPPPGTSWRFSKERFKQLITENRIYFGVTGNNVPRYKRFLTEVQDGLVPTTIWFKDEVGDNQEAKQEVKQHNPDEVFSTPKPERLIQRILQIASNQGDYVLDSFLGSGTAGAVAQKMNRKWIGIELGDHCDTHCLPRLQKVCEGTDQGGISESVGWNGGGGFKYYYLAPSLLKQDKFNNWVINPEYNADMLAAAMAKQEGFKYNPNPEVFWKQGMSSEKDFILTTTSTITVQYLDMLHEEMQSDESLLICCKAHSKVCETRYPNINIKKIPRALFGKCEFGKEDYSLNIINMPKDPNSPDFKPEGKPIKANKVPNRLNCNDLAPSLFAEEDGGENE